MGFEFKVHPHSINPSNDVIECWRDGVFVAAIYPHEDGIRVISKYMTDVYKEEETAMHQDQWLPAAIIKLKK